jgi:hypothetical protein
MIWFDVVNTPEKTAILEEMGNTPRIFRAYQLTGQETRWGPIPGAMYLLIYEDDHLIGFSQFRLINTIMAEVHPAVLPNYWGHNKEVDIFHAFQKLLKNICKIKKLLVFSPASCNIVQNSLKKCGAIKCGTIEDGIVYHGKIQDLYFYILEIEE